MKDDYELDKEEYINIICNNIIKKQQIINRNSRYFYNKNIGYNKIKDFVNSFRELIEKSYEHIEKRKQYRSTILKIVSNITSRKRFSIDNCITYREEDFYHYDSREKANLDKIFRNSNIFSSICEYIKEDELEDKFNQIRKNYLKFPNTHIRCDEERLGNNIHYSSFYIKDFKSFKLVFHNNQDKGFELYQYSGKKDLKSKFRYDSAILGYHSIVSMNTHNINEGFVYNLLSNFEKYQNLVENAIEEYDKSISAYEKEMDNLQNNFKKELIISDILD